MKCKWHLFFLLSLPVICWSQEDENQEKKLQLNGYLKDLVTINVADDSTLLDNLIHNRLNLKWYPNDHWTGILELRTRAFFGDQVRTINQISETVPGFPRYSELVDVNNDFFDLSWIIVDEESFVLHTIIDRAFIQYTQADWEAKLGRQRINWGINLVWNPNDLFNAFSFFDFDYEERPAADAIRITRYTGFASSVELAVNLADDTQDFVAAGLWKINKWNYDLQFLGSYVREDIALGLGWAGNIKTSGFKGEITYFIPTVNSNDENFLITLSWDHAYESSLYLHGSVLYNLQGEKEPPDLAFFDLRGELTAKDLSPYKYNLFLQSSYQFHPLVQGGIATIFYPGDNALFINPSFTVSVLQDLDIDVLAQIFYNNGPGESFRAVSRLYFFRVKWSF